MRQGDSERMHGRSNRGDNERLRRGRMGRYHEGWAMMRREGGKGMERVKRKRRREIGRDDEKWMEEEC